jgi:hypothetical protein
VSAAERYQDLCDEMLTLPGASIGRALSNEGLMVNGKLFAFLLRGKLIVKLPVERVAEVIAAGTGAAALMGSRTMKQWVEVTADVDWPQLARESYDCVRRLHST